MQTTQTFSLVGNDLPTNLLNVRDATIDTLTSLKDATKGGLLGVDLDSEIDKLEELQRDQIKKYGFNLFGKEGLTSLSKGIRLSNQMSTLDMMAMGDKVERSLSISIT